MTKKYYSKVSYGLLIFVFIVFFGPLVPILIADGFTINMILTILFLIIIFGFILHMFFKTIYTIEENKLKIKCGFFSYKSIEINDMREIAKSTNIISSPAASFDRIEIKYGKFDEVIISPKNKFEFAKDLVKINSKIVNTLNEVS
jgi:hypothetical protein